jgi:hypothetical protein
MPSSTLLQLVARGRQDKYLTNNPQLTFFKHVYRRYTPFAIESIPVEFDGNADFGKRISVTIPRKADLLSSMFIEVDLPAMPLLGTTTRWWCNDIGHAMIQDISIDIGDKEIDKHTGEWMQIWTELTTPAGKLDGFRNMVGHWQSYPVDSAKGPLKLTIPLRFWFCNSIGLALPLIALQAHTVRLVIHLAPFYKLWWQTATASGAVCPPIEAISPDRFQLFCDYVFLDKEERTRFATEEHEYLIEQVQYTPIQSITAGTQQATVEINFNHCVKEFFWVLQQDRMEDNNEWFNYSNLLQSETGSQVDLLNTAIIRLDGYDRFDARSAPYFRQTQPYQYHTAIPAGLKSYIYVYSFCLRPEAEQPSGSINCSRIEDIRLSMTFNTTLVKIGLTSESPSSVPRHVVVYATNYNVLRIVGGLGGVLFYT